MTGGNRENSGACGLCRHHIAHPLRPTEEKICGVLLQDCAQITVTPDNHECDFYGFEKKAN